MGLVKATLVLGIAMLLVSLMYSEEQASAWDELVDAIQDLPSFDNPFAPRTWTFLVGGDGTDEPADTVDEGSTPNCDTTGTPTTWFGCVNTLDANVSHARINIVDFEFSVNLSGFPDSTRSWRVLTVTVDFQCHRTGAGTDDLVFFDFVPNGGGPVFLSTAANEFSRTGCTAAPEDNFGNDSTTGDVELSSISALDMSEAEMFIRLDGIGVGHQFSFFSVTIVFQAEADCTSADTLAFIGCILVAALQFGIDAVMFVINGFMLLGGIIGYFARVVTAFIAVFTFFFAIPGAPTIIQAIIDVIVIGFIIVIVIDVVKIIGRLIP